MLNDWKPFKVIDVGEFRNTKGEMEKLFHVVLQVPGFKNSIQFEGTLEECEEECNELNKMISLSLSHHTSKS